MKTYKQKVLPEVVEWVKMQGFEEVKANIDGIKNPIGYKRKRDDDFFTPDITGFSFADKSYFEVVTKVPRPTRLITKLILLSTLAAQNSGKLFIIAPKGHYNFVRNLVAENNGIVAQVIKGDFIS
jgi:hypothetical protein